MELREYLFKNNIKYIDFAKKINYNNCYLSLVANYQKIPSLRLAKAISEATNGEVSIEEIMKKQR